MQYLKIPKDRVGALIGTKGKTKRDIETKTKTKITVEECSVTIDGESVDEWIAKDIVTAIARGFNPEIATKLLDDSNTLDIIYLPDILGESEKAMIRKKGRIIGEKGKSQRYIEGLTKSFIAIHGKTISIIGPYDGVSLAKEAIMRLIDGAPHSTVYRFLERSKK